MNITHHGETLTLAYPGNCGLVASVFQKIEREQRLEWLSRFIDRMWRQSA